jgi:hypothetical protein
VFIGVESERFAAVGGWLVDATVTDTVAALEWAFDGSVER